MLGRLLQVRSGESRRAALLFTYLFLVIASCVITKTARDPIFQEKFGSNNLTYVDMASALLVAAVMGVYLRLGRTVGIRPVIMGSLWLSAIWSVGFWFIARVREPWWMLPVLYVWASVITVLLPAQVWTLANQVMTTREAKRLFNIVSSGAISGGIFGGLVTRAVVSRASTADLLLPTALALACCPLLVREILRESKVDLRAADTRHERHEAGLRDSFKSIMQSPHLRVIAILIGTAQLVTYITGWQYKAVAKDFIDNTDQLAAFYGTFLVWAGSLSLITQLFIAPRLLRRFGLGPALLIVPVLLAVSSGGLLISGGLWAAILVNGSDAVVRRAVDRPTVEMLYLPVPARQMTRAKALIDTVVWRLGDGLGAVLVLILVKLVGLTPSQVSVVVIALLAVWVAAAVAARGHYVHSLRASIYEHRLDAERLSVQTADRSTTDVLIATLSSGNPEQILYALNLLEHSEPPTSDPAVSRLLGHESPAIRRKAISVLAAADDAAAVAEVEPLLHDGDEGVRAEALVYLARCGRIDPLTQVANIEEADGGAMASAIAYYLAQPGPAQNLEAVRIMLEVATSNDGGPAHHQARLEAARLIGSLPDQFEEQLNVLLKDPSTDVARLAIRAAAAVGKPGSMPLVVDRLGHPELSSDAADTLVAFGNRAIPALRQMLGDEQGPGAVRHEIPDVLQRIATPEAEQVLLDYLLDVDPVLRLRTVSALNKLRQLSDRRLEHDTVETILTAEILGHYRSYQLLARLSDIETADAPARARVKESMDQELERIFRLMKLLLPEHDLHSAYFGLQSNNALVHSNSLEFLEHALPARLRTLLLPLIDSEVSLDERIRIADRMVGATVETSEQALAAFAANNDVTRDGAK
jgi:AAA family ATP:ADP antiporter